MILRENRTHKLDYSVLALFAVGFLVYSTLFRHSPLQLLSGTLVFASLYIAWGIWHHARSDHLSPRVVLEYFLVATLGIAIVSTLLI